MDSDVVGMISGHIYYYLSDILPKIAKVRGWKRTTFLEAPRFLCARVSDHDVKMLAAAGSWGRIHD